MHVALRCPCGANLKADAKWIGREMKCPKCQSKLIVPRPPMAARSESDPLELEVFDPLDGPFAGQDPLQHPPLRPAHHPVGTSPGASWPQANVRPPQKGVRQPVSSRLVFWLVSSAAIILVLGVMSIFLLWEFNKTRSDLALQRGRIYVDRNQFENESTANTSAAIPPTVTIPPKPNSLDSGRRELRDPSIVGADANLQMADLIDRVEPSIVQLKVFTADGEGVGSGLFVDKEGKIVTNYHVIESASKVIATTADGKQTEALGYIYCDPKRDLAIIQVDPNKLDIVPIPIAPSIPRRGDEVAAFGSPAGFGFTASRGIISAIRTGQEISDTLQDMSEQDVYAQMGYAVDMRWIQTTAAISGGNSGGPLVNMRGEMVGVNTWQVPHAQNLNFASTLDEVSKVFQARTNELYDFVNLPGAREVYRGHGDDDE